MSLRLIGFPDHFHPGQDLYVNPDQVISVYEEGDYTVIRLRDGSQPAVDTSPFTVAKLLTRDAD